MKTRLSILQKLMISGKPPGEINVAGLRKARESDKHYKRPRR